MGNSNKVRTGIVTAINWNDNSADVREVKTHTIYTLFLNDVSRSQRKELSVHAEIEFTRDQSFEQFVVEDIVSINTRNLPVGNKRVI
jgi:hypothetical protein